jgi:formate dehydrogenase subunit delta
MITEKLARMANQIAANFDTGADQAKAVAGVVDHMRRFWTPVMLDEIAAAHQSGKLDLCEVAARAVEELAGERRSSAA